MLIPRLSLSNSHQAQGAQRSCENLKALIAHFTDFLSSIYLAPQNPYWIIRMIQGYQQVVTKCLPKFEWGLLAGVWWAWPDPTAKLIQTLDESKGDDLFCPCSQTFLRLQL